MTDIEKKALALVNETSPVERADLRACTRDQFREALCRAIEQHEAFRQEVSDAVEEIAKAWGTADPAWGYLRRFIIAKPDPLVEAMQEWWDADGYANIETFRAVIRKRGGKIVWGEEQ